MDIDPSHLGACVNELDEINRLLVQERTAILAEDLDALHAIGQQKISALQALATRLMALRKAAPDLAPQSPPPEAESSSAQHRAIRLLKQNFELNRNNGIMANLRAHRKGQRLEALLELNPPSYGLGGLKQLGYAPRKIARA